MIPLLPHHDGSPLYVENFAPSIGETVGLRLRVPQHYPGVDQVWVRSNPDGEPAWDRAELLGTLGGFSWWQARVRVANLRHHYRWLVKHDDATSPGAAPTVEWLNQSGRRFTEPVDAEDFALLAYPAPPAWLPNSVMYQIFPDRFSRSGEADRRPQPNWAVAADWDEPVDPVMPARVTQLYGGDLDGIVEKLDHLQRLGVTLLYLTPVFPAASNHRYDASSFDTVDPLLGGEEAYIRLIEAAHARGMKVIGDLTTNHSGDQHEWFQQAVADFTSAERSYYYFRPATDAEGLGYESWLGAASLPKFDWSSSALRRAFVEGPDSVAAKWLKPPFNLDGWRIDAANMTGRLGAVDHNRQVRQALQATMAEVKPDSILLAEITNDASGDLTGDAWHGAMTYSSFTRPLWSWLCAPTAEAYTTAQGTESTEPWFFGQPLSGIPPSTAIDFADAVQQFNSSVPWRIRLGNMHALDTHDTARFATHAAPGTVPLAIGLQISLPGVPTLFAGDEFGLTGADGELSRTPIPWGRANEPGIAERIQLYRELIGLRRSHSALATGGMRWLWADADSLVFIRESESESVLIFAAAPRAGKSCRAEVSLNAVAGLGEAEPLWGPEQLSFTADSLVFRAESPSFGAWKLPGVVVPWDVSDATSTPQATIRW